MQEEIKANISEADFITLVLQKQKVLKTYARNFTQNREDSEDLLQETNILILTQYKKYTHQGRLIPWAVRIMRNLFYNQQNVKKRIIEVEITDIHTVVDYDDDGLIELPKAKPMAVMVECMMQVNKGVIRRKFRDPAQLEMIWQDKFIHGMKVKDIAAKYDLKQGTVSSLLYQRGRSSQNKLQQLLLLKEKG